MTQDPLFPVLNTAKVKRPSEADRRLPSWLSVPIQFPGVTTHDPSQNLDNFNEFIDEELLRYLKKVMLIERFFPVQQCLIPNLTLQFRSRPFRRPNDICVSSPTGSGKTLAYAIPIVNQLKSSLTRSLRALVVLPSRDLAVQVHKVFQQVCSPTHLRCVLATGESKDLYNQLFKTIPKQDLQKDDCHLPNNLDKLRDEGEYTVEYLSLVDILISTPGVLIDLIHNSKGFSLKDLEILVIDEADRLMTSYKHDWLATIERSIFSNFYECSCDSKAQQSELDSPMKRKRISFSSITACAIKHNHLSKPLHKLLFSATLSSDPQLLMQMNLFQPKLFLAMKPSITSTKIRHSLGSNASTPCSSPGPSSLPMNRVAVRNELLTSSTIPEELDEKMFITEAKEKLFVIWYLFHELHYKKVICFTNQLQTSSRLCKFLNEVHEVRAVEFSSNLKPETRQKYLSEFKSGRVDVIVSTDLMARGMDVEGVEYVISYDMPSSEIFYVHRVGRTARAGNKGTAITLVDTKQLVQFKKIIQLAHKLPNSMRLADVVEEVKVPHNIKKDPEKYDLYTKTLDDFEDKVNNSQKKIKFIKNSK